MQTYLLNLTPGLPFTAYQTSGDLFVYESGTAGVDTADRRIVVKPDSGGEITLRPGQRFRIAPGQKAEMWSVRTLDNSVTLTGSIIIGSGEFDDANTLNKFTFDTGSGALPMNVVNDTAHRVPVSLGNASLNVSNPIMDYTETFFRNSNILAGAVQIVDPARNVNGIILQRWDVRQASANNGAIPGGMLSLLAKTAAPTGLTDGDILFTGGLATAGGGSWTDYHSNDGTTNTLGAIRIPAGKGLYLYTNNSMTFNTGGFLNAYISVLP
jgi:hypothetical protein